MRQILNIGWKFLSVIAVLLGIVGVSLLDLAGDTYKSHLAFLIIILAASAIVYKIWSAINVMLAKAYPKGYLPLSTFFSYSTSDGHHIRHEVYKTIQAKAPVFSTFIHKFYWTGTQPPKATSLLQCVGAPYADPQNKHTCVPLTLKRPLIYNEAEVIHVSLEIDDSDEKSDTYMEAAIEEPIKTVTFRVDLLHTTPAYHGKQARLEKYPIDKNVQGKPEQLRTIPFNALRKSFEHTLTHPEIGFRYRLSWDRPPTKGKQKRK